MPRLSSGRRLPDKRGAVVASPLGFRGRRPGDELPSPPSSLLVRLAYSASALLCKYSATRDGEGEGKGRDEKREKEKKKREPTLARGVEAVGRQRREVVAEVLVLHLGCHLQEDQVSAGKAREAAAAPLQRSPKRRNMFERKGKGRAESERRAAARRDPVAPTGQPGSHAPRPPFASPATDRRVQRVRFQQRTPLVIEAGRDERLSGHLRRGLGDAGTHPWTGESWPPSSPSSQPSSFLEPGSTTSTSPTSTISIFSRPFFLLGARFIRLSAALSLVSGLRIAFRASQLRLLFFSNEGKIRGRRKLWAVGGRREERRVVLQPTSVLLPGTSDHLVQAVVSLEDKVERVELTTEEEQANILAKIIGRPTLKAREMLLSRGQCPHAPSSHSSQWGVSRCTAVFPTAPSSACR